jgi:VWFA-related protein
MRKPAILLMLAGLTLPAWAAKRITVEQLEQLLSANHGKADAKVAQQLSDLELIERMSGARLSHWESDLPGPESRRSMLILADASAFLDPPAAEIPATVPPDLATQRQIMALAIGYATKTFSKLPDFFATRDTIFFEDTPQTYRADTSVIPYQSLHPVSRSSDRVLYRDGQEVVDSGASQGKHQERAIHGLTTSGVFGPILGTVLVDAAQGKLAWSHWEQGTAGPLAVFYFVVPKEKSHYEVEFCCVPGGSGNGAFQQYSGYHGEIAVDPSTGAILRLALKADLKRTDPLVRSDIMVEYGPVEIGGKAYICPLKSVSITVAPTLPSDAHDMQRYRGQLLEKDNNAGGEHLQTLLNDASFAEYHVFRTESRILTGDSADSGVPPPGSATEDTKDSGSPTSPAVTAEAKTAAQVTPVAPAASTTDSTPARAGAPEASVPEIDVTESAGLPAPAAATDAPTSGTGFTLHVTSRLVNVDVVAFDKKGHPVMDLKPEEFEIYDNGRKQPVQFLTRAGEEFAAETGLAHDQSGPPPVEIIYSNHRADTTDAVPQAGVPEGSATILLIDAGSVSWADLTYARDELLNFLQKLSSDERVGLYVQNARGFQILVEETRDHALLASTLRQWMPGAQDLARSQEMEQRNRQNFDDVLNPSDLQSVNGNISTAPDTATGVDPNLRDNGSNPGRTAMATLASVARHLAAIPGHKNLVWVASDNVLVDWTDKAVGSDKAGKNIDGYVLRAQEALNDAQVSIYPLDTSQLETSAIDPSLKNRNIELSPSVSAPPPAQGGGQAPGRIAAEMQQDIHPIQGAIQEMAEATGGRVFRRSGNIAENLNTVVADGRATYLLGFSPDTPADDKLHRLTLKLPGRRGVSLRYRTGYLYAREPAGLKERFKQAIWQALDLTEIAISAKPAAASEGATVKLNIDANDVALRQQGENWMDKLDIFLVQRDDEGSHARVTGQTLRLALKPATHERLLRDGIPFDQFIEKAHGSGSVRIIVVDENSGRMGSVTVPALALQRKN